MVVEDVGVDSGGMTVVVVVSIGVTMLPPPDDDRRDEPPPPERRRGGLVTTGAVVAGGDVGGGGGGGGGGTTYPGDGLITAAAVAMLSVGSVSVAADDTVARTASIPALCARVVTTTTAEPSLATLVGFEKPGTALHVLYEFDELHLTFLAGFQILNNDNVTELLEANDLSGLG